jgi:capsid protein
MKFLGINLGASKKELLQEKKELEKQVESAVELAYEAKTIASNASFFSTDVYVLPHYRPNFFDGEKNDGALGPILNYIPQYYDLNQRSWGTYITSDIAKTVIDKWVIWIVDQGLKLKSNPSRIVLESEGIKMDKVQSEAFNDLVESRFDIWASSKNASYSSEQNLKQIAKDVFTNAKIGGDVLVILRLVDGVVKLQLIDGRKIQHPGITSDIGEGNIVSNGVEIDPKGKHVGYWIKTKDGAKRIDAYSETGLRTAFLVKGTKWTLDYHRGLPTIAVVMESIGKLDRYKEAVVGNAEEIAKVVMQIVHESFSDGSNPLTAGGVLSRFQPDDAKETLPVDEFSENLAKKIAATYQKAVHNMPKGAEMKPVQPSATIRDFSDFYSTNAHIICAAVGIPPNVAFSLYTDSFSASRAATKDWDHTIDVERDDFTDQFYMHVYKFWFFAEVISGKVNAPGYINAYVKNNFMVTESYTKARFTGPHFPHIDPVKEVNAERLKLGEKGANIPLTTVEQATENLGAGDSDSNIEQFKDEYDNAKKMGLIDEPQPIVNNINSGT